MAVKCVLEFCPTTNLKNIPKDVCLSAFLKAGLTWLLGNTQTKKKKKKSLREDPYGNKLAAPPWQNTITLARVYHTDQCTQSLGKVVLRQAKGHWKHKTNVHKLSDTLKSSRLYRGRGACGDVSSVCENGEVQLIRQWGQEVLSLFLLPDQLQTNKQQKNNTI